jgi:putative sigma-54 modulation protein
MKIDIQSIHFDADQKLLAFITEKAEKLKHFYHGHLDLKVFLRLEKSHTHENKLVEMKLMVNGHTLFVEQQDKAFEAATDLALDQLIAQLKKYKEKVIQQHA